MAAMENPLLSNPKQIAELGEKIYQERYKEQFEREQSGKFVAIDVVTQNAYIGDNPESAVEDARKDSPNGLFHLVQVGLPGAFRVSYKSHANVDWVFR